MDSEIQVQIRSAVSAGQFTKASALWETYATQVAVEIAGGNPTETHLAQMRELIEWTRSVVICARAHAERRIHIQLTNLHAAAAYGRRIQ